MYKHMIAWEPTNSTGNALQGVINFIGAYIWGSTATRKFTQKKEFTRGPRCSNQKNK